MNKIKKLYSFDFDDTLFFTPEPIRGKEIWKEKTGKEWGNIGWWGRGESLDTSVFDIELNPWVYDKYLEAVSNDDNFVIMATGRVTKLRNEVQEILNMHNLAFDAIHLNNKGDTFNFKCDLFEKYINKIKPEEFIMYDDRKLHLIEFEKWARTIDCKITIVDVVNKTFKRFNY